MSISAAHLRELNALGIVGETLIRVVEIIDEASALSADKSADVRRGPLESTAHENRKSRDKSRKRLARAAEKAARTSAKLSGDKPADGPLSDSVVLTSLLPESGLQERKKDEPRVRARGTRMLPGAILSAEHRAIIVAEGIQDPEKLWVEFVDYWSDIPGQRGIKVRWDGTLRNRCRDVIKRGFNGHGTGNHRANQAAGQSGSAAIMAGVAAAAERRGRARGAGGPEPQRQPPRDADPAGELDFERGRASDG